MFFSCVKYVYVFCLLSFGFKKYVFNIFIEVLYSFSVICLINIFSQFMLVFLFVLLWF